MTEIDVIEQRLRRTFRVVAEQPLEPLRIAPDDRRAVRPGVRRHRPRRFAAAGAAALALALFGLALAYGPRSGNGGSHPGPSPATQPPGGFRAVFVPVSASPPAVLEQAASTMRARLGAFGDGGATVTVAGDSIMVSGSPVSREDLRLAAATGELLVRPVECGAPAYSPPHSGVAAPAAGTDLPQCAGAYQTNRTNLGVAPDSTGSGGYTSDRVPPDPAFASYPSTSADDPSSTVLLPSDPAYGAQQYARYVLGPAQLRGSAIAAAQAEQTGLGPPVVDITWTPSGSVQWDAIAFDNFHALIALDLDGQVISAPLIEPTQAAFASFDGRMQISGNFTPGQARDLAGLLRSGPLPLGLTLQSETSVSPELGGPTTDGS